MTEPDPHLHKLAAIAVAMVRDPSFREVLRDGQTPSEAHNTHNCLSILADAYVDLARRAGVKPVFRRRAALKAAMEARDAD